MKFRTGAIETCKFELSQLNWRTFCRKLFLTGLLPHLIWIVRDKRFLKQRMGMLNTTFLLGASFWGVLIMCFSVFLITTVIAFLLSKFAASFIYYLDFSFNVMQWHEMNKFDQYHYFYIQYWPLNKPLSLSHNQTLCFGYSRHPYRCNYNISGEGRGFLFLEQIQFCWILQKETSFGKRC